MIMFASVRMNLLVVFTVLVIIFLLIWKPQISRPSWDERLRSDDRTTVEVKYPNRTRANIHCPAGMVIDEVEFYYGKPDKCLDADQTALDGIILPKCQGKEKCRFKVRDTEFNLRKECQGETEKVLWGRYYCRRKK